MSIDQILITTIVAAALVLFVWGRFRYDIVALAALLAATMADLVPADAAFLGFGHPATITVAAVLVISRALANSGAVDVITRYVVRAAKHPGPHVAALSGFAAALSMVMNNVGALALLMPVALESAAKVKRPPAVILMRLSFGSILGGLATMIGTPPNIIVATYRAEIAEAPFAMFDFTPVGGAVALVGVAFVALIGWRLIPASRTQKATVSDLLNIEDYVTETEVPEGSEAVGQRIRELEDGSDDHGAAVIGLVRGGRRVLSRLRQETVRAGDVLIIEADPKGIDRFTSAFGLAIIGTEEPTKSRLSSDDVTLAEAVVPPGARIEGRTAASMRFERRYGLTVLAVSRRGQPFRERLRNFRFRSGDILLLRGDAESLADALAALGCLPLAGRPLPMGKRGQAGIAVAVFAAAIVAGTFGLTSLPVALAVAAAIMVVINVVPIREVYEAVDWPVIVLLGAMIPVAGALEATDTLGLINSGLLAVFGDLPVWALLAVIMVVTMTLSDIMNNAATAVVMAPLGAGIADGLGVSADPFLMAVAVGASCAFAHRIPEQYPGHWAGRLRLRRLLADGSAPGTADRRCFCAADPRRVSIVGFESRHRTPSSCRG